MFVFPPSIGETDPGQVERESTEAANVERDTRQILETNRAKWDVVAHSFTGTVLPKYGPLTPDEETLRLLPPLEGIRAFEIGFGSGHGLKYLAERGAAELWGIDISATQLALATEFLRELGVEAHLFQSPMEEDPGLPVGTFDLVFGIYSIGWSADLPRTLRLVSSYLKPGGVFLFSWEHPMYSCLGHANGRIVIDRPYHDEEPFEKADWLGAGPPVFMMPRTVSTYLNEIVAAGMTIERIVEPPVDPAKVQEKHADPDRWYSLPRAELVPTTLIVRARKPL
jgi:SAM-dependent methyltransferase